MSDFQPNIDWPAAVGRRADVFALIRDAGIEPFGQVLSTVISTLQSGGTLYFFGNGGSAAEAQHIAAEFVGHFVVERRALPAVALTTDTSALTAIGNDYSFEEIFARQIRALASVGDLAIGFTTSGGSANVIRGLEAARGMGVGTAAFVGENPGAAKEVADLVVTVPSAETAIIQEAHLAIWHIICAEVDTRFS
jgi:D-sedoheptulose 7-phosphate isomerase